MIYYTNDCCDCGLPCKYDLCPYYKVQHCECDFCKTQDVKLYCYDGYEICEECILEQFEVVEGTDNWC